MTAGFVDETSGFTMFILGYQSAYNRLAPDTYDIFPDMDAYSMLSWIENFCRKSPASTFSDGVTELTLDQFPRRQRTEAK